jgi:hypothetical protein
VWKVIDGITYDTHTAKRIAFYEFSKIGNWEWIYKVLYRTPTGQYFTYETGGCGTEYAVRIDNKMVGARYSIFAATDEQARRFLENSAPTLALKLFGGFYAQK